MVRKRTAILTALVALPLLLGSSVGVFRVTNAYPWEYLIEKEVRLQRVEARTRASLDRLLGGTKDAIVTQLGQPAQKETRALPSAPFWGPQEELVFILKAGQPYEEWTYPKGRFTRLVWFAGSGEAASDSMRWTVVATGTHREGVVY